MTDPLNLADGVSAELISLRCKEIRPYRSPVEGA